MSNGLFFALPQFEACGAVRLKPGRAHPVYYGPVRFERTAVGCRYWFLYWNMPHECRTCPDGFQEV